MSPSISWGWIRSSASVAASSGGWTVPAGSGQGLSMWPVGGLEMVAHHRPAERLGGMARPPADHMAGFALLVQDVPDGLR